LIKRNGGAAPTKSRRGLRLLLEIVRRALLQICAAIEKYLRGEN